MTTPDAGQQLIEDLRDPENVPWGRLIESCGEAADLIERLRGVEERYAWLREHVLPAWERPDGAASYPYAEVQIYLRRNDDETVHRFGLIGRETKVGMIGIDEAIDAAIAASRSTGAADVGGRSVSAARSLRRGGGSGMNVFTVGYTLSMSKEFPDGVPCVFVDGDAVYAEFPSSSGIVKAEHTCRLLNAESALSAAMCRD